MKKINTAPISGTQELLPSDQMVFDRLKQEIIDNSKARGYLNIETPILERTEVLLSKSGGETEKQIYKVVKTFESTEDSTEALRFDHTVPLARYVVEHENNLAFPFKVAQIGENFRGERAQRGRFRELYQCDIDVIGRGGLSLEYDADVLATLIDMYRAFGIKTSVIARISNRKILKGLLEGMNLEEKAADVYSIIDHSEKVPAEKTEAALDEIGLNSNEKAKILEFISLNGSASLVAEKLRAFNIENETFKTGISELILVMQLLEDEGYNEIIADMKIVRGLDYYTGTVFEFFLPEYRYVGSVGGGGRYENLAEYFTDQKFPGVGGSIGLDRLFYVLKEEGLIDFGVEKPVDVAILPMTNSEVKFALEVAKKFRAEGRKVTVVYGDKKLGDKMKYAASIARYAVVIGETEVASGKYEIKEFI